MPGVKEYLKKQHEALFQSSPPQPFMVQKDYFIQCEIKDRNMTAFIKITPDGNSSECNVTEFDIINHLYSKGVKAGLNYERIATIVSEQKFNQETLVARGASPEKGADGRIEYRVELEEFTTKELLKQFPGQVIRKGVQVELDQALAERVPPAEGVPGYTVKGHSLSAKPGAEAPPFDFGDNVTVSEDGAKLLAAMPGMAGLSKGKINVKDHEYEAWKYEVSFRKDNMESVLTIIPGLTEQPEHDESWLRELTSQHGIKFGINWLAHRLLGDRIKTTYVTVIAEGEPPVRDDDARRVEHFRRDGGGVIFGVGAGDTIVEKIPGAKGAKGRNVFDEPVPPPPGRDFELLAGDGAELSADGLRVTAAQNGYVFRDGDTYSVIPALELDTSQKPLPEIINHKGMVRIKGDVDSNHRIIASHHIEIDGDLKSSDVIAGGILHVTGAVSGCMKCKVQAGQDMYVGAAIQSALRVQRDLYINDRAIDSVVISGGGVDSWSSGKPAISGGRSIINKRLRIEELGSEKRSPTTVMVGGSFALRTRLDQVSREYRDLLNKFKPVNSRFLPLHKKLLAKQLPRDQVNSYRSIRALREAMVARIRFNKNAIIKLMGAIDKSARASNVTVTGYSHPGATVGIGTKNYKVDNRMKNVLFSLNHDASEIQVKQFN